MTMKAWLAALVLTLAALCRSALGGPEAPACCAPGVLLRRGGRCGEGPNAPNMTLRVNCTAGRLLLRDAIVTDNKLYTLDTPGFAFSENPDEYCLGSMLRNASAPALGTQAVAVLCYTPLPRGALSEIELSGTLTLVSVVFLLATVAVYGFLPQLRDLQGLCYMCVCASMSVGFLSLGGLQLSPGFRGAACALTGFTIYFWMMATFFWMNVVCFNMFYNVKYSSQRDERRLFFLYSCYGWGGPLVMLLTALLVNSLEGDHIKPGINSDQCWFQERAETWLFFYGPVAVLVCGNVVLFVLSSLTLWQRTCKYEVNTLAILKQRFLLCLKLFLVMGISWIFEIASFAHGESHIIWRIMDTFNCLQGVVIFVLLVVLRRRALRGLAAAGCFGRFGPAISRRLAPRDTDSADLPVLPDPKPPKFQYAASA